MTYGGVSPSIEGSLSSGQRRRRYAGDGHRLHDATGLHDLLPHVSVEARNERRESHSRSSSPCAFSHASKARPASVAYFSSPTALRASTSCLTVSIRTTCPPRKVNSMHEVVVVTF